jgi:two-component system sensor histidine kinase KdpD
LRVFLGAAPGVGKTYAMLHEAHRLKAEGHDVVVGFVETHGRVETEAQLDGVEIVPRLKIPYRGVTVEEMDTDAVLRRKPAVALVDELAHTNAPGSPRTKRWEDVEVLRDAGIDVLSTLNVQHLESLNDVVESITGVRVRETVPDQILDGATEVQLVDLPIEGLIERLEQGKVYPPGRARQALESFFREGNLTALRELALRRTAAGVGERLETYMREHAIEDVWPAADRVVVLVDGDLSAGTVLRNAWRLASGLHAELVAVAVLPPGGLAAVAPEVRAAVERNLGVAEDLGATTRVAEGRQVGPALAGVVREEHGTLVVLPFRAERGLRRLFSPSLAAQLMDELDNVDVHLVEVDKRTGPS